MQNKVDVILVPVGGCGLIAGVSLAVKTLSPETTVGGGVASTRAGAASRQLTSAPSCLHAVCVCR